MSMIAPLACAAVDTNCGAEDTLVPARVCALATGTNFAHSCSGCTPCTIGGSGKGVAGLVCIGVHVVAVPNGVRAEGDGIRSRLSCIFSSCWSCCRVCERIISASTALDATADILGTLVATMLLLHASELHVTASTNQLATIFSLRAQWENAVWVIAAKQCALQ